MMKWFMNRSFRVHIYPNIFECGCNDYLREIWKIPFTDTVDRSIYKQCHYCLTRATAIQCHKCRKCRKCCKCHKCHRCCKCCKCHKCHKCHRCHKWHLMSQYATVCHSTTVSHCHNVNMPSCYNIHAPPLPCRGATMSICHLVTMSVTHCYSVTVSVSSWNRCHSIISATFSSLQSAPLLYHYLPSIEWIGQIKYLLKTNICVRSPRHVTDVMSRHVGVIT